MQRVSLVIFHGSNFHFFLPVPQVATKSHERTYICAIIAHFVNSVIYFCDFQYKCKIRKWNGERCKAYCCINQSKAYATRVYECANALSTRSIPIINRPLGAPTKCIYDKHRKIHITDAKIEPVHLIRDITLFTCVTAYAQSIQQRRKVYDDLSS